MGRAVRPVAAANQALSLSHVTKMGSASVWKVWLETSVTAVAVVTMVSTPMAAQVVKQKRQHVSLATDWSTLSILICCDLFSSQHASVITLEGTVTLRAVSASAPPTQRETPVTGVKQVTGVTTPPQAVRYIQIHTDIHKYIQIHTNIHRCTPIYTDTHRYTQIQADTHKYTR